MLERAIENWLINTNERNYQIAFCHALLHDGHKIIQIPQHGPLEQGKDVITFNKDNIPCAYQLKTGDIKIAEWRRMQYEIQDLIQYPVQHPSINKKSIHKSYLVTNGIIENHVRNQITELNQDNIDKKRKWSYLDVIDINGLLKLFIDASHHFMPHELKELQYFLKFYLSNGRDFINKEELFNFYTSTLFNKQKGYKSKFLKYIYSSVIITSYLLNPYQISNNYYAQFEAWVILLVNIIRYSLDADIKRKLITDSKNLIMIEISDVIGLLFNEVKLKENFLEGNIIGDGADLYKARITLLLGLFSAYSNSCNLQNAKWDEDGALLEIIDKNHSNLLFWGESAFPFFFNIYKFLEINNRSELSADGLSDILKTIINRNIDNHNPGMPNPYYTVNDILGCYILNDPKINFNEFKGQSYCLESIIQLLAIREKRGILEEYWNSISHFQFEEFIPDEIKDFFTWRTYKGLNSVKNPREMESWSRLKIESNNLDNISEFYSMNLSILPLFILVCPHRVNNSVIKLLDHNIHKII